MRSYREGIGRGVRAAAALLGLGLGITACDGGKVAEMRADAVGTMLRGVGPDSLVLLSSGDTVRISAATMEFYRERGWQTAWTDARGPLVQGRALHEAVGRAWEDGLPPARYRHDLTTAVLARLSGTEATPLSDSLTVLHLAELDVLLSEGFSRLAHDLVGGMLDPAEAGLDYRIARQVPPTDILNRVVAGEDLAALLTELRPSMPQYARMRTALLAFAEAESRGGWPQVAGGTTLKEGVRAESVSQLRQRLTAGVDAAEAALARSGAADPSLFDADLKRAVQHFQDRHAIPADGSIGASTLRELNRTAADWISEMQLNLDRWRWLPNELGDRYVLVNIAGFELEVVDRGQVIETMNVVVGQLSTKTPIFSDSIRHVVVNPYWNVPDGIMERTIGPAMAADPSYLEKHDMEIVKGRVRQRPGPMNSLGRYKFIFPNEHDVYLHDTPDGHLFSRAERAFSSGCIRIERPRDLARLLLRLQTARDPDSLDKVFASGKEQWIALDRPLPVYLLYFTVWAQEDGSIRFHRDVYGRDDAMDSQVDKMKPQAVRRGGDARASGA